MMVENHTPLVVENSPPKIYKRKLRKKDINNNKGDEDELSSKSNVKSGSKTGGASKKPEDFLSNP